MVKIELNQGTRQKNCMSQFLIANPLTSGANLPTSDLNLPTSDSNLPTPLLERLKGLKQRESYEVLSDIIEEYCSYISLSIEEMETIFKRKKKHLWQKIVKPLKAAGKLSFTHPEMRQAMKY